MKVAAIQMVSESAMAHNMQNAERLLEQAAQAGAELALLPEYFCLMGHEETDKRVIAETFEDGPMQTLLVQWAKTYDMAIAAGTLPLQCAQANRVRNSLLFYGRDGKTLARYDKMHLFRFDADGESYDEGRVLERGEQPVCFDYTDRSDITWRIALAVCYDLRFPELFRATAPEAILLPAAFTHTTGQAHWEVLLRARAIENLAYVLASAQGGLHDNGRRTFGHSMSIAPWGDIQCVIPEGPGVIVADWDKAQLQQRRRQLPTLGHRLL